MPRYFYVVLFFISSRLFDLIRIEEDKFKPAFYYAVRDTLVASDLTQATRFQHRFPLSNVFRVKKWRIVTLKVFHHSNFFFYVLGRTN